MSDSTSGNLTLPEFVNDQKYILSGQVLNQILAVVKENRVVLTGKTQYDSVGPDGSKLDIDLALSGCTAPESCVPEPDSPGTFVLGSVDGEVDWIETENCGCGTGVDGGDP